MYIIACTVQSSIYVDRNKVEVALNGGGGILSIKSVFSNRRSLSRPIFAVNSFTVQKKILIKILHKRLGIIPFLAAAREAVAQP